MASPFRPSANMALRMTMGGLLALGVAVIAGLMLWVRTPWRRGQYEPIDQPVEFDHRHHVRDDGIDCVYCHNTVFTSSTAGIPSTDKCMGCHSQIWNQSPATEPIRRSFFSGAPIPWNRVHDLPDFVYFNHSIHVNKGVGCVECHGRVDEMARVYQVKDLTMTFCLECHRNPAPHLRPPDQITSMTWKADRPEVTGKLLENAYGTRKLTTCTTCHR
jgi:hypothetical protein